jgi:hypothetical protein
LFSFVLMKSTVPGCFRSHFWSLWKALEEKKKKKGCISLVSWHLDLRCKSSWILNDYLILSPFILCWVKRFFTLHKIVKNQPICFIHFVKLFIGMNLMELLSWSLH